MLRSSLLPATPASCAPCREIAILQRTLFANPVSIIYSVCYGVHSSIRYGCKGCKFKQQLDSKPTATIATAANPVYSWRGIHVYFCSVGRAVPGLSHNSFAHVGLRNVVQWTSSGKIWCIDSPSNWNHFTHRFTADRLEWGRWGKIGIEMPTRLDVMLAFFYVETWDFGRF